MKAEVLEIQNVKKIRFADFQFVQIHSCSVRECHLRARGRICTQNVESWLTTKFSDEQGRPNALAGDVSSNVAISTSWVIDVIYFLKSERVVLLATALEVYFLLLALQLF